MYIVYIACLPDIYGIHDILSTYVVCNIYNIYVLYIVYVLYINNLSETLGASQGLEVATSGKKARDGSRVRRTTYGYPNLDLLRPTRTPCTQ